MAMSSAKMSLMFSSPSSLPSTVEWLTCIDIPLPQVNYRFGISAQFCGNTSIIDRPPPREHTISYIIAFKVILVLRCRDSVGVSYRHGLVAGVFDLCLHISDIVYPSITGAQANYTPYSIHQIGKRRTFERYMPTEMYTFRRFGRPYYNVTFIVWASRLTKMCNRHPIIAFEADWYLRGWQLFGI